MMKDKISCLDRRTNQPRSLTLYPEIKSILEWCADNRIALTICSKCPDFAMVKQILTAFGIWEWFMFPQIFNSRKTYHFRNLTEATGLKMNDFLFFDDDNSNIHLCMKIGVASCLVDKQKGLTWANFVDGLSLYYNTHGRGGGTATPNPNPSYSSSSNSITTVVPPPSLSSLSIATNSGTSSVNGPKTAEEEHNKETEGGKEKEKERPPLLLSSVHIIRDKKKEQENE
jgi:magnesium-dependent phosphatase-1